MLDTDPRIEQFKNVTDLRQYDRKYKVINDGTAGDDPVARVWELCIPGKHGQIYPHGFNGDLAVSTSSSNIYHKLCEFLSRPVQESSPGDEFVMMFPHRTELLHGVAGLMRARLSRKGKGRKFTPEQIAASAVRLRAWEASRKKPAGNPNS